MAKLHDNIERYKKGEMSSAERHKLERQALNDPFLADALEGMDEVNTEEVVLDLSKLRSQLSERTASKGKAVSMTAWWIRIAAGVIILLVGSYLLTNLVLDERREIAMKTNPQPSTPAAPGKSKSDQAGAGISDEKRNGTDTPAAAIQEEEHAAAEAQKPKPAGVRRNGESDDLVATESLGYVNQTPPRAEKDMNEAEQAGEQEQDVVDVQAEPVMTETQKSSAPRKNEATSDYELSQGRRIIRGKVLDSEDGKGLPGVNVTIAGTNTGTVTNSEGNYEIILNDLADGLQYSFIGFESQEVVPGSSNEVNITLQPDYSQLSEVVVVGYGVAKDTLDGYPIIEMASPAGGRKAYRHYLENELRYPQEALENNVEGKVTVQFTVETSGNLSDFKVLKGIGHGCDEEVIRLIKEGPKWAASRRNMKTVKDRVRVRLKFALPKK